MPQPCMLWRCIAWERERIIVLFRSDRTHERPLVEGLVDRIASEARRQFPECAEQPYKMARVCQMACQTDHGLRDFRVIEVNISEDGDAFSDWRQWTDLDAPSLIDRD